jgi:hypothetical protein
MHEVLDDVPQEAVIWMPSHLRPGTCGTATRGDGFLVEEGDVMANDAADKLAKAAVECSAHVHERIGDDACGVSFERCSTNKYYALFALDTTASVSRLAHYGQVWMMQS